MRPPALPAILPDSAAGGNQVGFTIAGGAVVVDDVGDADAGCAVFADGEVGVETGCDVLVVDNVAGMKYMLADPVVAEA